MEKQAVHQVSELCVDSIFFPELYLNRHRLSTCFLLVSVHTDTDVVKNQTPLMLLSQWKGPFIVFQQSVLFPFLFYGGDVQFKTVVLHFQPWGVCVLQPQVRVPWRIDRWFEGRQLWKRVTGWWWRYLGKRPLVKYYGWIVMGFEWMKESGWLTGITRGKVGWK